MKHCSHYYTFFSHLTFELLFAPFPFLDEKKKFCTFVFLQKVQTKQELRNTQNTLLVEDANINHSDVIKIFNKTNLKLSNFIK